MPKSISRCFSKMKAQQAPPDARHSFALVADQSTLMKSQSSRAGTSMSSYHATISVRTVLSGEENKLSRIQPISPWRVAGGGRAAMAGRVGFMSALHQRDAPVVPVHEKGNRQADTQVGRNDDEDALDGLT